jgi:hypothetical protein
MILYTYIFYLKNGGAFIRVKVSRYLRCFVYTVSKLQCSGMQEALFSMYLKWCKFHYKRLLTDILSYYAVSNIGVEEWAGLLGLLFNTEDGGSTFLQNVSNRLPNYTVSHPPKKYVTLHSHCHENLFSKSYTNQCRMLTVILTEF